MLERLFRKFNRKSIADRKGGIDASETIKHATESVRPFSAREFLLNLGYWDATYLHRFDDLPAKIQDDIVADITKKRKEGMINVEEIFARLNILIEHGEKLIKMDTAKSDTVYRPVPKTEDLKLKKELGDMGG